MKIVFVGGGTSGHFYPLMAVAEKIEKIITENRLAEPKLYYFGEKNFNPKMLEDRNISYSYIMSGKNRLYFSFQNFTDIFKIVIGFFTALFKLLFLYPDVIFSKGGYDSIPTCLAAFILRIPIVMHDSDALPGRASILIAKFATRIAVSYPEASRFFKDKNIVAITGQPILEKYTPEINFSRSYNTNIRKNILVLGGSSGSLKLNDAILEILPELCSKYNVVHQTGQNNFEDIKLRSGVILESYNKNNYAPYAYMDLSKIYPQMDLVIGRAGSAIFEYKAWQIPAIVIPISQLVSRDQVLNAEASFKSGGVKIINEENLSSHLLLNQVNSILDDRKIYEKMLADLNSNKNLKASYTIATEIIKIAESHR